MAAKWPPAGISARRVIVYVRSAQARGVVESDAAVVAASRGTHTRAAYANAARGVRAIAARLTTIGRLRAAGGEQRDAIRRNAHASDVGQALLAHEARRAH